MHNYELSPKNNTKVKSLRVKNLSISDTDQEQSN